MNKEAIDLLIRKRPRLKRFRTKLEAMQPGRYCVHRAWGIGQIRDFDEREAKLIIDFEEGKQSHPMDPAFCVEKLEILEDHDILVRARKEPDVINEMKKDRPADIIVEILSKAQDNSATATEIETTLSRLLGASNYKKFWTATKKALVKDPRVAVPSKKTDPFVLREEPVRAEDEILEEFFETKAPKKKINLASKLIELSVEHSDIEEALPDILKELTASLAETKQLKSGERLHGIWIRNDLARFIHEDVETLEPTSESILRASPDLSGLADQIPASHHKRYLDLIERIFPDTWTPIVFELLKNSSGKLTSECTAFLFERGLSNQISETFQRWLVEQNLKAPVLTWILKNRNSRKYSTMLEPLMRPRLLSAIFYAIDYEALQNTGTRRIPLAEFVSDDQELISDLLATATPETAHDLATTLMLNQGFEDLSKKSLLARFIKIFPGIQKVVSGEVDSESRMQDDGLIVSRPSLDQRHKEYDHLVKERIPQNKIDIAEARAHGDLRENAEYKMARQEQDILLARKAELERDFDRARVSDFTDAPKDKVGIGCIVEVVQGSTDKKQTYSILGAWDGDPDQNVLSYQTPLAQALLSRKVSDQVEVEIDDHKEEWTIVKIGRWVDAH